MSSRRSTYHPNTTTRPHSDMGVYGSKDNDEGGTPLDTHDTQHDTQNRLRQIESRLNAKGVCSAESNAIRARSILLAGGSQRKKPRLGGLVGGANSSSAGGSTADRRGSTHHHHSSLSGGGSRSQFLDKLDEAFGVLDSGGGGEEVDSALDVQGLQGYFPSTAQHNHSTYMGRLTTTTVNGQPRGGNHHRRSVTSLSSSQHNHNHHNTNSTGSGAPPSIINNMMKSSPPPLHPKGQHEGSSYNNNNNQHRGGELRDVLEQRRRQVRSTSSSRPTHDTNDDDTTEASPSVLSVGDVFQQAKQSAVYPHAEAQLRAHMKKRTDGKKHYSPTNTDHDLSTPAGPVARYLRSRGQLGQDKEVPFARVGEGIPVSLQLTAHEVHGGDPAVKREAHRIRLKAEESVKKDAMDAKNAAAKREGEGGGGAMRTMVPPDDGASPDGLNALREEADALARGNVRRLCEQPEEGDLLFSRMDPSSLVHHAETTLGRREKHHAESVARATHAAQSVLAPKTASLVSGLLSPNHNQSSTTMKQQQQSASSNHNAELREALQRSSALQAVFLAESDSDDDEMDDEKERNVEELIETGDARRKRRRDIRAAVLLGMLAATQQHGDSIHSPLPPSSSSSPPIVTESDMLRASAVIGRAAAGTGIPTPLDAVQNTTTPSSKPSRHEIEVTPEEALEDVCDLLECCIVAFCQYLHRNTFLVGQGEGGGPNASNGLYSPSYTGPPKDIGVLRGILVQALSSSLPELKAALEYGGSGGSPTAILSSSKVPASSPMQGHHQKVFSPNAPTNLSVTAMLFSAATGGGGSGGGGSSAMTPAMKALLDGRVSELRFRFLRSWTKAAETLLSLDLKHHRSTVLLQPRNNNNSSPRANRQNKHWGDIDDDNHSDQIFKFSVSHPAATAHERHHRQTRVPPSFFMVHFDEHLQHAASYYCSLHRRRIARSQELMQRWRANKESREMKLLHGAAVNPFHAELDPRYLEDLHIERARDFASRTTSESAGHMMNGNDGDNSEDPTDESRSRTRSRINGMIDFFTSAKEQLSTEDLSALDFNSANVIHKQRTLVSAFLEKLIPKLKQGDDFKYTGTVEGKLLSRITEQQQDASHNNNTTTAMSASALPPNPYDLSAEELIAVREGDTANKEAMSVLQRVLLKVHGSKAARTSELYGGVPRNEASKQQQGGYSLAGVPREGRQVSRFREVVMRYANLDHEDFDNEEFGINPSVEEDDVSTMDHGTNTTMGSVSGSPILSSRGGGQQPSSSPTTSPHAAAGGAGGAVGGGATTSAQHIAQAKFMSLFRSSWGRSPLDRDVPSDEAGIRSQVLEDALLVRVLDAYFYLLSQTLQSKIRQFVQQAKRQAREAEAVEQRDQALTTGGGRGGGVSKIKQEEESAGLKALKETLGAQMRDKYSNNDIAIERRFQDVKARRADLAERLRSGDTSVISELVLGNNNKSSSAEGGDDEGGQNTNAADRALDEKAKKLHKLLNSTDSWFVYEQNKRHAFDELSKHDLFSNGGGGSGESPGGPQASEGDPLPQALGLLSSNLRRPTQGPQGGSDEGGGSTGGKVGVTAGGRPKNEVTRLKRLHELEASWSLLQISHSQRINLNDKWATLRVEGRMLDRATALYREAATRVVKREGILEDIVTNEKRLLKLVPGGNSLLDAMTMLHAGSIHRSTAASSSSPPHHRRPDLTTTDPTSTVPTTKKECELLRHKLFAELTKASQECDVISHRLHQEVGDDLFFRDIAYLAKMRGDAVGLKDLIKRTGVAT